MNEDPNLNLIRLLLARLERISVDSYWAHRASGVRGSLLRLLDQIENQRPISTLETKRLIRTGFDILSKSMGKYSS